MTTTTTPPQSSENRSRPTPRTGRGRSAQPSRFWMLGVAGGLAALLTAGWFGYQSFWPAGPVDDPTVFTVEQRSFPVTLLQKGELKAAESVDVRCMVEGRSTIIFLVPEGTEVKEGDLLVELASDQIDERIRSEEITVAKAEAAAQTARREYEIQLDQNASDIRKAELALKNAETELEKYEKGDWEKLKTDADIAVQQAEKELSQARQRFEDSKELFEKKFITKLEYEADEFSAFVAEKQLAQAKLARDILHKYTHPQNMLQKRSDVNEAKKDLARVRKSAEAKADQKKADLDAREAEYKIASDRLDRYREQKSNTKIYAPASGLVVYYNEHSRWGGGDDIKEGAEVRERQILLTLPDTSRMKVIVRIHEAVATKLEPGQPVTVEVEGIPGEVFRGEVTHVAPLADSQHRWLNPDLKVYETEVTLDETSADLKPGVTARAEIHVEDVNDALAVPLQAVYAKSGHHFVFRVEGGEPTVVEVEPGSANDEFVEIASGLSAGDQVLLALTDELKRMIPEPETPGNGVQLTSND